MASIMKTSRSRKRTLSPSEETSAKKRQSLSCEGSHHDSMSKDRNSLPSKLKVSLERCDSIRRISPRKTKLPIVSTRDEANPKAIPTSMIHTTSRDSNEVAKDMYSAIKQRKRTPPQKQLVLSNTETESEPIKSPSPRKRGRPRKPVKETDGEPVKLLSPKKRGRPRKSVEETVIVPEKQLVTDEAGKADAPVSPSTKKRLRPRKSVEKTVIVPEKQLVPSEPETGDVLVKSLSSPKKIGRPRKSIEETVIVPQKQLVTDEAGKADAPVSPSTKKRLRPRKSVEETVIVPEKQLVLSEPETGDVLVKSLSSPKKIGRPRKSIEETVIVPQKQLVPSEARNTDAPVSPSTKKRLRPRKLVEELATVTCTTPKEQSVTRESQLDNESVKVTSPRKRGRPRKSVGETCTSPKEQSAVNESEIDYESVKVASPRKRGRPRKSVGQTDSDPVKLPSPKKRGRPRKSIEVVTVATADGSDRVVKQETSGEISQKQIKKETSVICVSSSDELTSESEVFPASTQSSQRSEDTSTLPSQSESQASTASGSEEITSGARATDVQDASKEVRMEDERSLATNQRERLLAVPKERILVSPEQPISPPLPNMSSSKSHKQKSRRRSTFAVGRKSKGIVNLPSSELCKTIPKELPEEERLARLQQLLIRRTLQKMEAEAPDDDPGFAQFKLEALEKTEKLTQRMREDGTFKQACTPRDRLLPNPVNIQNEKRVEIYKAAIVRLNTECDSWNDLLQKREHLARDAKTMFENQADSIIATERPSSLSQADEKVLDSKPDYKKILSESLLNYEFAAMFVDKIQKTVSTMSQYHQKAKECIRKQSENLSAQVLKDVPDPRDTISALLEK